MFAIEMPILWNDVQKIVPRAVRRLGEQKMCK